MGEAEDLKRALSKGRVTVKGVEEDRLVDRLSEVEITEKDRIAIEAEPKKPSGLSLLWKIKRKSR